MKGRTRCRIHGAKGGGPRGEANGAWKTGAWTNEAVALRREASRLVKQIKEAAQ